MIEPSSWDFSPTLPFYQSYCYNFITVFLHTIYERIWRFPVKREMTFERKCYFIPRKFCKIAEFHFNINH